MNPERLREIKYRETEADHLYKGEWRVVSAAKFNFDWTTPALNDLLENLEITEIYYSTRSYITKSGDERYRIEVVKCTNGLWTLEIKKDATSHIGLHVGRGFLIQGFEIVLYDQEPTQISAVVRRTSTQIEMYGIVTALWEAATIGLVAIASHLTRKVPEGYTDE